MTPLASDFDAASGLAAAVCFAAPTRHGALRLELRRAAAWPPRIAASLRAAALLADAEALLQWLEDWLGEPLDPAPVDTPAELDAPSVRLHWRWGPLAVAADLPWTALLACRPAPELAAFWRDAVRWEELDLQLVLAQEALADDEWQALQEPGAAWLVRDSFAIDGLWPCELRLGVGDAVHAWPAHWRPGSGRLEWRDARPPQRPVATECAQAVLARPLRLTPPALLGWHGDTACDCRADQPASLLPAARHGGRPLSARLLPIGLRLPGAEGCPPGVGAPGPHAGYVLRVEAD